MDTEIIRHRLHNYLEAADDEKIEALFSMVQEEMTAYEVTANDSLKLELDRRLEEYKQDASSAISQEDSKRRILEILKGDKK